MSQESSHELDTLRLILAAENSRKRFPLTGEMLVGRDSTCAIALQSLHISRYHAKIIVTADGASIEDLDSANGTYVNGLKLGGRVSLHLGDLVCFDDHGFRIIAEAVPEACLDKVRSITAEQVAIKPQAVTPPTTGSPTATEQTDIAPEITLPNPNRAVDEAPAVIEAVSADTTRALTFHEMKEILRQSQAIQAQNSLVEPRLIVQTAPLDGKVIALQALEMDTRWKVGSDLTSKICLRDKSLIADHAYLSRNPSGYRLTATSAAKAYKLNGKIVRDGYLQDGDLVQLGRIEVLFKTNLGTDNAPPGVEQTPVEAAAHSLPWPALITGLFFLVVLMVVVVRQA